MAQKIAKWTTLMVLFGLFIYIVFRAYIVAITIDEVCTFERFVQVSFLDIYFYNDAFATRDMIPNNHLLNSWLMRICCWCFGTTDFTLRLPNVLSFILAAWAGYHLVFDEYKHWLLALMCIAVLFLDHHYIQFFALARGYGMSHAFMLASMYFGYRFYCKNEGVASLLIALALAFLAVLANLLMLNFYLALLFLFTVHVCLSNRTQKWLWASIIGFVSFCFGVFLYQPIVTVIGSHQGFGGTEGFFVSTIQSLSGSFLHVNYKSVKSEELAWFLVGLLSVIFSGAVFYMYKKGKSALFTPFLFFTSLLGLNILASVLQNLLFKTVAPMDRTALYFIPLFALAFYTGMNQLYVHAQSSLKQAITISTRPLMPKLGLLVLKYFVLFFSGAILLAFCLQFTARMNFVETKDWYENAYCKMVYRDIKADLKAQQTKLPSKAGCAPINMGGFNFYVKSDTEKLLEPSDWYNTIDTTIAVQYWFLASEQTHLVESHYEIIKQYGKNSFVLMRKKDKSGVR